MEHYVAAAAAAPPPAVAAAVVEAVESDDEMELENDDVYTEIPVIHLRNSHLQRTNSGTHPSSVSGITDFSERRVLDVLFDSEENELFGMIDQSTTSSDNRMLQAALVATSTRDIGESARSGGGGGGDSTVMTIRDLHLSGEARAEFISVLLAPAATTIAMIGLKFHQDQQAGTISHITEGSVLSNSPLRAGDQLLSVNGKSCKELSSESIANLILKSHNQYLQMVFRNPMEDANAGLVQCMLMKQTPNDSLGMKMGTYPGGEIRITEITPNGIAGKSFLNVGDTILQVNGISCSDATTQDVVTLLQSAPKYVNISVRAGTNTAVVVSEVSTRFTLIQAVNTTGVPDDPTGDGAARRLEELQRRNYQWGLLVKLCFPLLIVAVVLLAISLSNSHGASFRHDCSYASTFVQETSFPFMQYTQTSALFNLLFPAAIHDDDTEDDISTDMNATSSTTMNSTDNNGTSMDNINIVNRIEDGAATDVLFDVVETMNVFMYATANFEQYDPKSRWRDPTDAEVDRLLENSTLFFAQVLEEHFTTQDRFLSIRLDFQSWSYAYCNDFDWSSLDLAVFVEASFLEGYDMFFEDRVREVLRQSGTADSSYLVDYVNSVGNASVLEDTISTTWYF